MSETNDEILFYLKIRDAKNHLLSKQLQLSNVAFNYFSVVFFSARDEKNYHNCSRS